MRNPLPAASRPGRPRAGRLGRRPARAAALLAPVYGRFIEGFATKDLKEAEALLQELETD